MKVYLVINTFWPERKIEKIFENKNDAKKFVDMLIEEEKEEYEIKEYNVIMHYEKQETE